MLDQLLDLLKAPGHEAELAELQSVVSSATREAKLETEELKFNLVR